ncbi:MAG: FhaA domain-containing protein [Acidimicrobiales bacterium]
MGLAQFERRLERLVEGVFARAFRGGLQPVEIGRRLTREMDLRRTMAPRGTLTPNRFEVLLSSDDLSRFAPIVDELVDELVAVAEEHARVEHYVFIGPVSVTMDTDEDLAPGMLLVSGEMARPDQPPAANLVLPDGRRVTLGGKPLVIGRLSDSGLVLADPNVSRYHAEVRPAAGLDGGEFEVSDMGSTNGTKVNGLPVVGAQILRDGDQLTVGATTIRFERA